MKQLSSAALVLFALVLAACEPAPGPACSSADEECTENSDCCTGLVCDGSGVCVLDAPVCIDDGLGCTTNEECCSGACGAEGTCTDDSVVSCFQCACELGFAEGGCADVCDSIRNGTGFPNFCDGVDAGSQCEACIASMCGNPFECN